ncbi:MAG: glycosyltransferase family 2 protein [Clostridia bacterium]|nr:glycosyltransferase family 2 protein [Clostridia bacterium]
MKPLVSVIVATYRRDTTLSEALQSLRGQSYPHIEIVLVDDNDEPEWNRKIEKIAADFQKSCHGIVLRSVTNHPNRGSAEARNAGIRAAAGEYVTFLDDDDVYLAEKVERQVSFMEENGLDYSITDLYLYTEKGKPADRRIRSYIKETDARSLFEYHLQYHLTGTDTMMFRRDYLLSIGGFPPINVGDEFYLMQRAIEKGGRFGYLPFCDVKAYVHTGESGLSGGRGKIDGENALYEHKKQYFDRLSPKSVKYIKARHYAVLAYAYLRMRSMGNCLKSSAAGFFASPTMFFRILLSR